MVVVGLLGVALFAGGIYLTSLAGNLLERWIVAGSVMGLGLKLMSEAYEHFF